MALRVLIVYHVGRNRQYRSLARALGDLGVEVTMVVPETWPEAGCEQSLSGEPFTVIELPIKRAGDANQHRYTNETQLARVLADVNPDVLDIHEEPYSLAARQWLGLAPHDLPVVLFTAQNIDKRYPPPYAQYERAALRRVSGMYPCSRQAAAVARGKGFAGLIRVLPLGYDPQVFTPGSQSLGVEELTLLLAGRLIPEKGIADAITVLECVNRVRPARLVLVGEGPMAVPARELAISRGLGERVETIPWHSEAALTELFRTAHVVLVPSRPTYTWVEQFGRVITEAQASGALVAGYANGAIPDIAGTEGILVATGHAEQLARGVAAVLADPGEFARRRDAGRIQAAQRTWGTVAQGHRELYEQVRERPPIGAPDRSPRVRRALARDEFGPTANALGGARPFALPLLRAGGGPSGMLARVIDAGAEATARVRG